MAETGEVVFEAQNEPTNELTSEPTVADEERPPLVIPPEVSRELCSMFGCTQETLGQLLSTIHGDPDKILPLLSVLAPSYVAVRSDSKHDDRTNSPGRCALSERECPAR